MRLEPADGMRSFAQRGDGQMQESGPPENETVPFGQRLCDSPFLLLALGILVMAVFYSIWGLIEVLSLPQATLP